MAEPYYYRSAEDVVPLDAVHVIVCGSVRVVPANAFKDHKNLKRLEFQEGVQVIGTRSFEGCRNLERAILASSIRTIGERAFYWCGLSEVVLLEGLEEIGGAAFQGCALERITVPSSVVTIGDEAFAYCWRLSEVNLTEGLIRIGAKAFFGCALEQIAVPSSVVEIGEEAFWGCNSLSEATLVGGMVMVAREVFDGSRQLRNIATPSETIVVEDGVHGNGRAAVKTRGTIALHRARGPIWVDNLHRAREPNRLILTSPYLAAMKSEDVERAKDAINRIAGGRPPGEGLLDIDRDVDTVDEWIRVRGGADRIRARFRGLLSAHRKAIASILERAFEPDVAGVIASFLPDVEGR